MILSEIYQMHDRLCAVVLDPESGTLTPIRVVNLDTKELTSQFSVMRGRDFLMRNHSDRTIRTV